MTDFIQQRMQDVVNKVYDHFITREEPFGFDHSRGMCTYTNPACAVGIFLKEEDLKLMATYSVLYNDIEEVIEVCEVLPSLADFYEYDEDGDPSSCFLKQLQDAHDRSAGSKTTYYEGTLVKEKHFTPEESREQFKKRLNQLCADFCLTYPGDKHGFD